MSGTPSVKETAERTAAVSFTELNARRLGPIRRFFRGHPRVTDAAVVLGFLILTLPNALPGVGLRDGSAGLAPAAASAVALMFRRNRPLLVLAVISILEPITLFFSHGVVTLSIGIWVALYTVAIRHPLRTTLLATVAASIPAAGGLFVLPPGVMGEPAGLVWLVSGIAVLFLAISAGIGVTVRRDRTHETELREWAGRNAELASAGERNRIAREMHDVVAHSLTVMVALSDGAAIVMTRDQAKAQAVLGELSATGRHAIADMRRVLGVLRTEPGDTSFQPLPASSSLAQLLDGFRSAGLPLRVLISGPALPADSAFQLTLYRIIQESLTNVLRYGKGVTVVEVSIARTGDEVAIRIADDGKGSMGPVVSQGSGQGIAGMRERAAIYSGTLECGTRVGGGWVVDVRLTVPDSGNQRGKEKDDRPRSTGKYHPGAARGRPTAPEDGLPAHP